MDSFTENVFWRAFHDSLFYAINSEPYSTRPACRLTAEGIYTLLKAYALARDGKDGRDVCELLERALYLLQQARNPGRKQLELLLAHFRCYYLGVPDDELEEIERIAAELRKFGKAVMQV